MRKITSIIVILLWLSCHMTQNMTKAAIGEWTTYLAYGDITDIEPVGNRIFVLSSGALFAYHVEDQSVVTYDKARQLNDTGIAHIAWCNAAKRLVIIYDNQNIDLLGTDDAVINISDYNNKFLTADKTVNNITIDSHFAYLSTGFGVLKLNVKDAEISDTYNLGMKVTDCAISGNMIYAQTAAGIYAGNTADNLLDKGNWHITTEAISFSDANDIAVSHTNGYTEYIAYDKTNKCYWSNQKNGKLQGYQLDDAGNKTIVAMDIAPDAPKYNYFGFLKIHENKLYSCNGGMWDELKPASIQIFDFYNKKWTIFNNEGIGDKYGIRYMDILTLDIDPRDSKHIMAGSQAGLFEFYNGEIVNYYNYQNSPIYFISGLEGKVNYQMVTSLLYNKNGDLFVANSANIKNPVIIFDSEKNWKIIDKFTTIKSSANLKFLEVDSNGKLWVYTKYWENPAIYSYDYTTDNICEYSNYVNQDGTTIGQNVYCKNAAEDLDGNIWVGLNNGLFLITELYNMDDPEKGFYQVKVPRNDGTNYADYLLSGADITAIAIDSANRKWIGTNGNGIYLISADNMVEEEHFTTSNSPLLSDVIESISIDDKTGIVFLGTEKGLCSYQSEATQTNELMDNNNVWAYPNPVTPEYNGMITITGLSQNSDVKITTSNGILVAEGSSTGGSFLWNGKDLKGNSVASGVYMVNTATSDGQKGTVCKVVIVK